MRLILWVAKFAVSVGLLWILFRIYPMSLETIVATLRSANPVTLGLAAVLLFNQWVLSSIKWRIILVSHGIHLPLGILVRMYMVGTFVSSFLPSSYSGDLVRIADVARVTGRTLHSATAVVLERLSGLVALTFAGGLGCFLVFLSLKDLAFLNLALIFLGILLPYRRHHPRSRRSHP